MPISDYSRAGQRARQGSPYPRGEQCSALQQYRRQFAEWGKTEDGKRYNRLTRHGRLLFRIALALIPLILVALYRFSETPLEEPLAQSLWAVLVFATIVGAVLSWVASVHFSEEAARALPPQWRPKPRRRSIPPGSYNPPYYSSDYSLDDVIAARICGRTPAEHVLIKRGYLTTLYLNQSQQFRR
jgi:hypothetical protein